MFTKSLGPPGWNDPLRPDLSQEWQGESNATYPLGHLSEPRLHASHLSASPLSCYREHKHEGGRDEKDSELHYIISICVTCAVYMCVCACLYVVVIGCFYIYKLSLCSVFVVLLSCTSISVLEHWEQWEIRVKFQVCVHMAKEANSDHALTDDKKYYFQIALLGDATAFLNLRDKC